MYILISGIHNAVHTFSFLMLKDMEIQPNFITMIVIKSSLCIYVSGKIHGDELNGIEVL